MGLIDILQYGGRCNLPTEQNSAALEIRNLNFSYGKIPALENINITVQPGERVALAGPNGAGKSTLLQLVLGKLQLQSGSINVYGHKARRCHHRVAIIPQRSTIDWNFPLSVRQVVTMGRYVHLGWLRLPQKADRQAVEAAMEAMNIADLAMRQIGELSGGQQQRVMLARVLAQDADLLLLDEPLNHVDIGTQELIFHTLEELSQQGKTSIISTHDLGVLTVHFSRVLFLDTKIIADGPVDEVMTPETIARAYGFEFHKDYHHA